MQIVTKSHINEAHAAGQYFPLAESADGRFSWNCSLSGYVAINCALTGLPANTRDGEWHSVYLQYPDKALTPELIAEARAFSAAVDDLKRERELEAERKEIDREQAAHAAMVAARGPMPTFKYRSSEAAWEAEDETAWALMRSWGL